jgi:hypothetical protein
MAILQVPDRPLYVVQVELFAAEIAYHLNAAPRGVRPAYVHRKLDLHGFTSDALWVDSWGGGIMARTSAHVILESRIVRSTCRIRRLDWRRGLVWVVT